MKLKKVSRVLSLVVAGAMVLAMAPAAFAVTVGNFDYDVVDSAHHKVIFRNPNGSFENWGTHPCSFDKDTGKCICGNACSHVGAQNVVDNGDGTHNVVCPTCNKVVDTAKHSYNENGKCACGATCNHMGQHFKFVANNNGTHNVLCDDCDAVVSENVPCTYVDGKCEQCGAEKSCDHMGQHFKFVANNNGTHNVLCADCDAVVSENVPCTYVDGKCQQCDAEEPACDHMGQHFKFVANNNGTHNVLCADCDAVVSENVPCTYVDGKCQQCDAEKPVTVCDHMGQHFKFVANNDGTHNVLCADCDAVVSKNVPCTYVDGECEQCGAAQPAPVPTPAPGSSVGPVATTIGLGAWLLVLGGLILGFFGL